MKDFPLFTTEYGAASLILREIPYQQTAYIHILDSLEPEKLLEECVSFCRMCGAEWIYAKGHDYLEKFPLYTGLWEMRCSRQELPETDAVLIPVQDKTMEEFRRIYNSKVRNVPCGAWMTQADAKAMLAQKTGYFIHREGKLLGIGMVDGETIPWVASLADGAGADVVSALACGVKGNAVSLTVADANIKALALYERLGFVKIREISRFYCILHKNNEIIL